MTLNERHEARAAVHQPVGRLGRRAPGEGQGGRAGAGQVEMGDDRQPQARHAGRGQAQGGQGLDQVFARRTAAGPDPGGAVPGLRVGAGVVAGGDAGRMPKTAAAGRNNRSRRQVKDTPVRGSLSRGKLNTARRLRVGRESPA